MEARAREAKQKKLVFLPVSTREVMPWNPPPFDAAVEQARTVPIEDELARRGFHLRGKIERT